MDTRAQAAYTAKVLDPEVHDQLVRNVDDIALRAGIPAYQIFKTATETLPPKQMAELRKLNKYRYEGRAGFLLTGSVSGHSIEQRMQAMTAWMVRNFIDARMMTLNDLFDEMPDLDCDVLLVPNFLISKQGSRVLPAHKISDLLSLLIKRMQHSQLTILYARTVPLIEAEYGDSLSEHIQGNYLHLTG